MIKSNYSKKEKNKTYSMLNILGDEEKKKKKKMEVKFKKLQLDFR